MRRFAWVLISLLVSRAAVAQDMLGPSAPERGPELPSAPTSLEPVPDTPPATALSPSVARATSEPRWRVLAEELVSVQARIIELDRLESAIRLRPLAYTKCILEGVGTGAMILSLVFYGVKKDIQRELRGGAHDDTNDFDGDGDVDRADVRRVRRSARISGGVAAGALGGAIVAEVFYALRGRAIGKLRHEWRAQARRRSELIRGFEQELVLSPAQASLQLRARF